MFYKRPTRSGRLRFRSSILSIGFLVLGWVKSPEILRGQAIGPIPAVYKRLVIVNQVAGEASARSEWRVENIVSDVRILGEHLLADAHLLAIVHAINPLGRLLCFRQGRQQHPREDGDDGDYHQ